MQHFPIFLNMRGQRIVVSGAGETAVAKLRLLLKSEARIVVYGSQPTEQVRLWAQQDRLTLHERRIEHGDSLCARLFYAANDDPEEDQRAADIGHAAGSLVNIVDNLADSQFITPAIVDRDPVTVAIGTEGAAPVLARRIKADAEARLDPDLGILARIGKAFRPQVETLPAGRLRRAFWARFYDEVGPAALDTGGEDAVVDALEALLDTFQRPHMPVGRVDIIGAGPGDPELLTLKARNAIHDADVIIHDRLVSTHILELARREAIYIDVGKTPGGPSWSQEDINALLVEHALKGHVVARLKSGDPGIYGRLDEEMDALDAARVGFTVIPGITSASAAAASIRVSMTRRHRNSSVRFLTGHDVKGFADQDWRGLAAPGATAAIYMGVRAARFLQGRLMIHGARRDTPMTAVENASRTNQKVVATTLGQLPQSLRDNDISGPTILFLGLEPRAAVQHVSQFPQMQTGVR